MDRAQIQRRAIVTLTVLLGCCSGVRASDPSLDISQYAHTAWKIREGFTKGTIFSIAQTPDGYLWLGTEFGLVRFDGVKAAPWQPPDGQELPSNWIQALLVARDGTLWIATEKGLASLKDGKVRKYPEVAGQVVTSLLQGADGTVWFGVRDPGRLCSIRDGTTQCDGAGKFGFSVHALYEDRKGNLWASAQTGLWRWAPGPPEHHQLPGGAVEAKALIEGDNGELLMAIGMSGPFTGPVIGVTRGLQELVGGRIVNDALPGIASDFRPTRLFRSGDGSLWIGTIQGLLHVHQGRTDEFSVTDGLSGNFIRSIFEDREGNVWVCTENGLDRFREFAATTISEKQGLSTSTAYLVEATPDGSIWTITAGGLNRWRNGHMTVYGNRNLADQNGRADKAAHRTNAEVTAIANSGIRGTLRSLGQDDLGRLWAGGSEGVFYFDRDRFLQVPGVRGGNILSIVGDGHGKVWISNLDDGLFYSTAEGLVQRFPWARFRSEYGAVALLADRLNGGLWLGFADNGIAYLKDGQVRSSYTVADGLGDGSVNDLQLGADGAVWAATEGGLSRVNHGLVTTMTSKNGLPCNAANSVIEDNDRSLWLYMTCGLVRIARPELDAWESDSRRSVRTTIFDSFDGARNRALAGGHSRLVAKSPDGKIWFSPPDGVSAIDPRHLPFNKLPPSVLIEQIIADGKMYIPARGLRLPARVHDLAIDFTALSLTVPEKVHFRFKLEGQDEDWREEVNVRQVQYSNLRPGPYRFRVSACNNSGVWNDDGTFLDFGVAPAYYQTNWFRVLGVGSVLILLWMLYLLRIQHVRTHETQLRDVIDAVPANVWSTSPDGAVDFVNQRWQELTGLPADQALGWNWEEAVHPEDRDAFLGHWHAAVENGEAMEHEVRVRRPDGKYRWLFVRNVPLRNEKGNIIKWYGTSVDIEDRKRAEQALIRSEAYLAEAQKLSGTGSFAYNPAIRTTVFWSEQLFRIFRLDPRNGIPSYDETRQLVHPDDRDRVSKECLQGFREKTDFSQAYRLLLRDGAVRHLHAVWHPVLDKTGELVEYVGTAADVTDRELADEKIRQSESELRQLIDVIPQQVLVFDAEWTPLFANQRDRDYTGLSLEQAQSKDAFSRIFHPEDLKTLTGLRERALLSAAPFELEARIKGKDGQYRWFLIRYNPLRDDQGRVIRWYGTRTDIEDRKRAEEALKRSETYLAESQRLTHTGSWAIGHQGGITPAYWSQENLRIWGFDPQDGPPTLEAIVQRIHPEDRERIVGYSTQAVREGRTYAVEGRIVLPDGTIRYLHSSGHPVLSPSGELLEVVGTHVDITERKRAEQEREKLRQLEADLAHINRVTTLGELAASLAHELKQPIAAAVTNAEACLRTLEPEQPDLSDARDAASGMVGCAKRAAEIIDRVRALFTKNAAQHEVVDVNEVIRDIVVLFQNETRQRGISILVALADNLPKLIGDRVQLQQVMLNLLLNGFEAMRDNVGELRITSQARENEVLVSVIDTGVGLPTEKLDQIFDAFFTTKPQGTGMGLAISRSIIEAHGGRLWAVPNSDRGATFHFTLPCDAQADT